MRGRWGFRAISQGPLAQAADAEKLALSLGDNWEPLSVLDALADIGCITRVGADVRATGLTVPSIADALPPLAADLRRGEGLLAMVSSGRETRVSESRSAVSERLTARDVDCWITDGDASDMCDSSLSAQRRLSERWRGVRFGDNPAAEDYDPELNGIILDEDNVCVWREDLGVNVLEARLENGDTEYVHLDTLPAMALRCINKQPDSITLIEPLPLSCLRVVSACDEPDEEEPNDAALSAVGAAVDEATVKTRIRMRRTTDCS